MSPSIIDQPFEPSYDPDLSYGKTLQIRRKQLSARNEALTNACAKAASWGSEGPAPESTLALTQVQVEEIYDSCRAFCAGGYVLGEISRENFPLPLLEEELARRRQSLHSGDGFVKFTGLDPTRFSMRENVVILSGLSMHLTRSFGKQGGGKLLVHLKNLTNSEFKTQRLPAPYVTSFLPPHTDCETDVVAMYVIQSPQKQGKGIFSSVQAIYDDLARLDPEAIESLQQPNWPFDRPKGNQGFSYRPVLYQQNGHPEMFFSRGSLIKSPRNGRDPKIPKLSREQARALDAVHFSAMENMHIEPWLTGDMVFFNNRRVLHGREAFVDPELTAGDQGGERHILRIFLGDRDLAGPPPEEMKALYDWVFDGDWHSEDVDWPMKPHPD